MLVRWNPVHELSNLQREMYDLFERNWVKKGSEARGFGSFLPPADIRENKNSYVIELDLPGIDQKDITVGIENDLLTIKGERLSAKESEGDCSTCSERIFGSFIRSFSLPGTADGEKVGAVYKNGVLTLTVPKKEEAKPKMIKVEVQ